MSFNFHARIHKFQLDPPNRNHDNEAPGLIHDPINPCFPLKYWCHRQFVSFQKKHLGVAFPDYLTKKCPPSFFVSVGKFQANRNLN